MLNLTIEDVRKLAADLKDDYQRQANQGIRKQSSDGELQGLSALASMEAVDRFVYDLELRAGAPYRNPQNRQWPQRTKQVVKMVRK
ncbi:MAG: hypothetical protein ACREQ5_06365 [Candidatus Dormibacteria bacterium]